MSCGSSLKEPVQHLWPMGGTLKYIWLYITSMYMFDSADAFYMIAPMCKALEYIKAAYRNGNGSAGLCDIAPQMISCRRSTLANVPSTPMSLLV